MPWRRPLAGRDPDEPHRASTPLELLFDLSFVVGVATVAAELAHGVAEDHVAASIGHYLMVFFAIWWAWMNFSWFASAYDTDDVVYRLLTLVQIAGVLVLAAGVPAAFEHNDFTARHDRLRDHADTAGRAVVAGGPRRPVPARRRHPVRGRRRGRAGRSGCSGWRCRTPPA